MRRFRLKYVAIGLGILFVILMPLLYYYVETSANQIEVRAVNVSPIFYSRNISITVLFDVFNPSLISVDIINLPFSVSLSNFNLGTGRALVPFHVPANGHFSVIGILYVDYSSIQGAVVNVIRQYHEEKKLTYLIAGRLRVQLLWLYNTEVAFSRSGRVFE